MSGVSGSSGRNENTAARVRFVGPFDVFGVCDCGYFVRMPFGNPFHIHTTVCPECGAGKGGWKKVRGRPARVGGGFWSPGKLVLVPKEEIDNAAA